MSDHATEGDAYWAAFGKDIEAAHARCWHLHSRRHHRIECRCKFCVSDGREECSEERPCGTCRAAAKREN